MVSSSDPITPLEQLLNGVTAAATAAASGAVTAAGNAATAAAAAMDAAVLARNKTKGGQVTIPSGTGRADVPVEFADIGFSDYAVTCTRNSFSLGDYAVYGRTATGFTLAVMRKAAGTYAMDWTLVRKS